MNVLTGDTRLVQLLDSADKRCFSGFFGRADPFLLIAAQFGFQFLLLARVLRSTEFQQLRRQWRQQMQESDDEISTPPDHSASVVKRALASGGFIDYHQEAFGLVFSIRHVSNTVIADSPQTVQHLPRMAIL